MIRRARACALYGPILSVFGIVAIPVSLLNQEDVGALAKSLISVLVIVVLCTANIYSLSMPNLHSSAHIKRCCPFTCLQSHGAQLEKKSPKVQRRGSYISRASSSYACRMRNGLSNLSYHCPTTACLRAKKLRPKIGANGLSRKTPRWANYFVLEITTTKTAAALTASSWRHHHSSAVDAQSLTKGLRSNPRTLLHLMERSRFRQSE